MPNPRCDSCKPDKPELHPALIERDGCVAEYAAVQECMDANKGSISQCNAVWDTFKKCHKASRQKGQSS